ncbi:MAG: sulfatase-like hydrolase/transferase [Planctomycetota bacterium]|nr:sulfatase-like hydrolase/transferase [Planctomycetaceae bacterium]MDQ3329808.1 sulfatase-like hydrolase/transferase [Planctomycetota bacterium]
MNRCFCGLALILLSRSAFAIEPQRPNVLFLFTDDQRADAVGAFDHPVLKTPNLDALVRSGFTIKNAYCLGSNVGAVCSPSRNMLLSGRAYFRWEGRMAPPEPANWPDSMKAAGYETYHHGKRGNTAIEIQKRFDHNKYVSNDEAERRSGEPGKEIVDDAVAFLKDREAAKPFFMYLAFGNPHDPRVAAQKYRDLYDAASIPLPKNYLPVHPFDNGWMTGRDESLAPWPRTEDIVREHLHDYYATITALDSHIGRLLSSLDDHGLRENTLIVFSSDHGLAVGSHGLFGKQNVYEDGMKAPLVFSGAGIRYGESDAMVYLVDLYPTVCDLVGVEPPTSIDGRSFANVLRGESDEARDAIFLAYEDMQRAVRDDRWKLIVYPKINRVQLFDLKTDPHEIDDLADAPQHRDRIERLMTLLAAQQKTFGDTAALSSASPQDATFTPPAK